MLTRAAAIPTDVALCCAQIACWCVCGLQSTVHDHVPLSRTVKGDNRRRKSRLGYDLLLPCTVLTHSATSLCAMLHYSYRTRRQTRPHSAHDTQTDGLACHCGRAEPTGTTLCTEPTARQRRSPRYALSRLCTVRDVVTDAWLRLSRTALLSAVEVTAPAQVRSPVRLRFLPTRLTHGLLAALFCLGERCPRPSAACPKNPDDSSVDRGENLWAIATMMRTKMPVTATARSAIATWTTVILLPTMPGCVAPRTRPLPWSSPSLPTPSARPDVRPHALTM